MKKVLIVLILLALIIGGGVWYMLSGAGDLIRTQIEEQGSKYLGTKVSVFSVDLALTEGRLTVSDIDVENPAGFSKEDAFSLQSVTLDLGGAVKEPYVVQNVNINAPEILYEVDAKGQGNLIVLKNNLAANLPKNDKDPANNSTNPLVIVENVTVEKVRLKLNFEQLPTAGFEIETKSYELTLPTFMAGPIGKPNGMPADKVGLAIVNALLDNVIAQAKAEAKKRVKEEAKKKLDEKIEKEKDKLKDKAASKLKDLFGK